MKQLSQLHETVHQQATRITELTSTTQNQLHLIQSQQTDIASLYNTLARSRSANINCSCHEQTPNDDQHHNQNHKTSAESLKYATATGHRRAGGGQQLSADAEPEVKVETEVEVDVDRRGPGAQTGSFDCGMSQFWNDGAAGGYTRTKAFSYTFNTTYPRPPQVQGVVLSIFLIEYKMKVMCV